MKEIQLADLVKEVGQAAVAKGLNCTQPAINKALKCERQIMVTVSEDGTYEAHELKPFPSQVPKAASS